MRGLTIPQRLGYFASIFYFLHGIPRIICLVAPLFALLLGIIPVMADVPSLVNFFGSYYLATLVMLRTVSRGTRNAFWSDIYETADSVAMSWATLKTALKPWKKRPFIITPKGVTREQRGFSRFSYVLPHLVIMGLLIAGIVTGIRLWLSAVPVPGLEVSLFWAAVNLLLIGVAILAAAELTEWRNVFRIKSRMPCELIRGRERLRGRVEDINETGVLIQTSRRLLGGKDSVLLSINTPQGDQLVVRGQICRQHRVSSGVVDIGLKFLNVDDKTVNALLAATFSNPRIWNKPDLEPGIFRSLWSILRVFSMVFTTSRASHRRDIRILHQQECRLVSRDRILIGNVGQISKTGISLNVPGTVDLVAEKGTLYLNSFVFKVRKRWAMQCKDVVRAGFTIEQVDEGAEQWQKLTSLAA